MEWRDEALVIGLRRHGESAVIMELMTRAHGRHLGLMRGGGRGLRGVLQPGDRVAAHWRARLEEQLGNYAIEPLRPRAARLLDHAFALRGVSYLSALLRLLPERDPHAELFDMADALAEHLQSLETAPPLMARFELEILSALGFGLDLEACALTGAREDLAYVSPKSGRAVTRLAGEPWRERLLPFPQFLQRADFSAPERGELAAAFRLTGHFLERDVFSPRAVAAGEARALYLSAAVKAAA
jgi:DNA repair protein RecO (recombination protein O)